MLKIFIDVKIEEYKLLLWSFIYFFMLLASYFVLRPLRDEMGIVNGASNMQWLFTGTFLTMLLIVPAFGYITSRFKIGSVLVLSYVFFIVNILLFYYLFTKGLFIKALPIIFFIWLSVFNLFAISLFWSFMVDVFTSNQSKRLFGIISAGGSLGAIFGPLMTSLLSNKLGIENLFLIAIGFLLISLIALQRIIYIQKKSRAKQEEKRADFKDTYLVKKSLFDAIKLVFASKHLKRIVLFMILYTSVSTFLYFEQATIVEQTIHKSSERIAYFSKVDLVTNILAITGQFFLTSKIIKQFGLSIALGLIPLLIALGFIILSTKTILPVIAILLIIHRAGNYTLLRPGREILYTVRSREEKYKAKNFIDTAIYRGGDALSGWVFAGLISMGLGLSIIALIAVPIGLIWGYTGFQLGKKQVISQEHVCLKIKE